MSRRKKYRKSGKTIKRAGDVASAAGGACVWQATAELGFSPKNTSETIVAGVTGGVAGAATSTAITTVVNLIADVAVAKYIQGARGINNAELFKKTIYTFVEQLVVQVMWQPAVSLGVFLGTWASNNPDVAGHWPMIIASVLLAIGIVGAKFGLGKIFQKTFSFAACVAEIAAAWGFLAETWLPTFTLPGSRGIPGATIFTAIAAAIWALLRLVGCQAKHVREERHLLALPPVPTEVTPLRHSAAYTPDLEQQEEEITLLRGAHPAPSIESAQPTKVSPGICSKFFAKARACLPRCLGGRPADMPTAVPEVRVH